MIRVQYIQINIPNPYLQFEIINHKQKKINPNHKSNIFVWENLVKT